MSLLDALDNAIAEVEAKQAEERENPPSEDQEEGVEGLQADGVVDAEGKDGGEETPAPGDRCKNPPRTSRLRKKMPCSLGETGPSIQHHACGP